MEVVSVLVYLCLCICNCCEKPHKDNFFVFFKKTRGINIKQSKMQNFGHRDFLLYFLISYYFIAYDYGVRALLIWLIENAYFSLVELPYNYLAYRRLLPFPYQTNFSQRATDYEFVVVEMLKHYFKYSQGQPAWSVFFDGRSFELLNKIRRWRECNDGLGDTAIENICTDQELNCHATWIYTRSRVISKAHDILIFYIHGGNGFGVGSGHLYNEYLSILLINLLEQGFSNPGILVPIFLNKLEKYPSQISQLMKDYQYLLTKKNEDTHIVLMSDSTGSTLAISMLLNMNHPSNGFTQDQLMTKPDAAIFISPITKLFHSPPTNTPNPSDYLTQSTIHKWAANYIDKSIVGTPQISFLDPSTIKDCQVWRNSMPQKGVVISYGDEECIKEDIEGFIQLLTQSGVKLKVDKQIAQVHNWSILGFYTERLIDHREASLQMYSGILSRMFLWNTPAYVNGDSKEPTNIITIDEEYT